MKVVNFKIMIASDFNKFKEAIDRKDDIFMVSENSSDPMVKRYSINRGLELRCDLLLTGNRLSLACPADFKHCQFKDEIVKILSLAVGDIQIID